MKTTEGGPNVNIKVGQSALSKAIGDLLQRTGLSQRRKRRRRATPTPSGVPPIVAPNDVWCIDFKGWLRTGDGAIGYPLTVTDAFSRYLLCCCGLMPDYEGCRRELERLFGNTACALFAIR